MSKKMVLWSETYAQYFAKPQMLLRRIVQLLEVALANKTGHSHKRIFFIIRVNCCFIR